MTSSSSLPIALVTGANRGIGFEIARQLSVRGFLVIAASRTASLGMSAAERILADGGTAETLVIDVASEDSIRGAAAEFRATGRCLRVLVNNAAILEDRGGILSLDPDLLRKTIDVNTIGALRMIQEFVPVMEDGGRIVNVSSSLGSLATMGDESPAYSISKVALNAVTRQCADALLPRRIAVNAVCPGWVRTEMGGMNATRSVEKGAETAVWLAAEAPQNLTGAFVRDKRAIAW